MRLVLVLSVTLSLALAGGCSLGAMHRTANAPAIDIEPGTIAQP